MNIDNINIHIRLFTSPFMNVLHNSFPRWWLVTGFVTRLTRRVSLVDRGILILPEHPSSPPDFSGIRVTRSLVYMYVLLIVVCPFVLFLLAIVLSVLLRYTDSDFSFGIFKLFFQQYLIYTAVHVVSVNGRCWRSNQRKPEYPWNHWYKVNHVNFEK